MAARRYSGEPGGATAKRRRRSSVGDGAEVTAGKCGGVVQWEYRFVSDRFDAEYLNRLGAEGWEAVSAYPVEWTAGSDPDSVSEVVVLMKRRLALGLGDE